jgi:hypothetical protein
VWPRFPTARGLLAEIGSDLLVATCRSRHAVGPDVVVTVGPNALLFFWRGHADPAPRGRPGPRFPLVSRAQPVSLPRPAKRGSGVFAVAPDVVDVMKPRRAPRSAHCASLNQAAEMRVVRAKQG